MSIYNTPYSVLYYVYRAIKYSYYIAMEFSEAINKIAFNIKVLRMKNGLTQAELAEKINVHEKYIGKIETGRQNLTVKTLVKIANALSINLKELLN